MSVIKDAVAAMKEVLILTEKVEKTGHLLTDISRELRKHDRRLVRLETVVEIASSQVKKLPKPRGRKN